jgi:hypothetical protein
MILGMTGINPYIVFVLLYGGMVQLLEQCYF